MNGSHQSHTCSMLVDAMAWKHLRNHSRHVGEQEGALVDFFQLSDHPHLARQSYTTPLVSSPQNQVRGRETWGSDYACFLPKSVVAAPQQCHSLDQECLDSIRIPRQKGVFGAKR